MLVFLLTSVLFLIAGNGALMIFFDMIQPGGALDVVFGWQKMLARLYRSEKKAYQLLEKALGGCERCVSFWFMPGWFFCYFAICKLAFHVWVTDWISGSGFWYWVAICLVNWVWYSLFHTLGAMGGHIALTKLFKKKANAV